jgi:hypothetical protein
MKARQYSGADTRLLLAALATDTQCLTTVAPHHEPGRPLFGVQWADMVAGWCFKWYRRWGTAPGTNLEEAFARWAEGPGVDPEHAKMVDEWLAYLSQDWVARPEADRSTEYLTDLAGQVLHKAALRHLVDGVGQALTLGDTAAADALVGAYRRPNVGVGSWADPTDPDRVATAWADVGLGLLQYPDALGSFFGSELGRDCFVSILAPEKRGKTWWLLDGAWVAAMTGLRVAVYQVGDLSEPQALRRLAVRAATWPAKPQRFKYPMGVHAGGEVDLVDKVAKVGLGLSQAQQALAKLPPDGLRMVCHPSGSLTADGLRGQLLEWASQGWVADVVVLDYADILATPNVGRDGRDGVNENWKALRRLSQELHCLVYTATQCDTPGYDSKVLTRRNFSEDKRKLAHVTGMFGLNQTVPEARRGMMRVNWVVSRETAFKETDVCHVAGCLAIGRPAIFSTF